MKKLTILSLLTVALAGVAVQKASAGVVVRASIGLPIFYAPAPAYYATPAPVPAYTYTPNYVYSTPPPVVYAPPAVVYTPPPPPVCGPPFSLYVSRPFIGLSFGPGFRHFHHHGW